MATEKTLADVYARARSNLNDMAGVFWTDAKLFPKAQNAYAWAYSRVAEYADAPFRKIASTLTYTANATDLSTILPVDIYLPEKLYFRKNTSEEWVEVNRKDFLPSQETQAKDRVLEWVWQNRTIIVNPASEGGKLKLVYLSLLPDLESAASKILIDNLLEALAYFLAAEACRSRGQHAQAAAMLGTSEPPTGALGFMDMLTTHLVKNEQWVSRRGAPFSSSDADR